MNLLRSLVDIHSADPEEARRRKLLNILLVGSSGLTFLALLATIITGLVNPESREGNFLVMAGSLIMFLGIGVIFLINRYGSGKVASSIFILLFIAILTFMDQPEEVVAGRTLFLFAIPVLMGSVLLRSYGSFIVAAVVSLAITAVSLSAQIPPNVIVILGFFTIALVSWLSARSLERAVQDVHQINRELDQRVTERTHDLADALARERSEANKNQAILEGIADGVIVFDAEGRATLANPAISRLLNKTHQELVGQNAQTIMGDEVNDADKELLYHLLTDKAARRPSIKIAWAARTLSVSLAPVSANNEDHIGTVAVFRDFTREAELDRMKSDFVSIASHELRTPLTVIRGYVELMLAGTAGEINQQQREFVDRIRNNTNRLHDLVNDLLDLSRIESGNIDLNMTLVTVTEIIEEVAATLQQEFAQRNLQLILDIQPNLPQLLGDKGRLTQIMFNLISNAYKYTPSGSVTVRTRQAGNALEVEVIDTGVGISASDQEKLFTRFFRSGNEYVRQQSGTGLGLNITRSLIMLHGGQIEVESKVDKGSVFRFTLPLPQQLLDQAQRANRQEGQLEAAGAQRRIMVIDDDADVAEMFRFYLTDAGYAVRAVTDPKRVIQAVNAWRPDLITLDLLMEIDGLTLLRELKSDERMAAIPVVIVSVVPEPPDGVSLGAAAYLTKPLEEGALLKCVNQFLHPPDRQPQWTVLVVDDEKDIVEWLRFALTHYGYQVQTAYDGVQALESVAAKRPDLIILDLQMPRMDGRTTIHRLREEEAYRNIPIIILSANTIKDQAEKAQMAKLGVREFLQKPTAIQHVVEEIEKCLSSDSSPAA